MMSEANRSLVVLVTGCGSGFGRQIARLAAERGHRVYAGFRNLCAEVAIEGTTSIQLDITSPGERAAAVARIVEAEGRLDALVNNAGVVLGGFAEALEEDELRNVLEVNFFSAFALTKLCLPALRASKGVLLNISSISGLRAFPGLGGYAASKFALEGLTEALYQELEPLGVRVMLVEPGTFRTEIWGRNKVLGRQTFDPASAYAPMVPRLDAAFDASADRSAGDPQDVADAVVGLVEKPSTKLRHVFWGTRKARLLFMRLNGKLTAVYPEEP